MEKLTDIDTQPCPADGPESAYEAARVFLCSIDEIPDGARLPDAARALASIIYSMVTRCAFEEACVLVEVALKTTGTAMSKMGYGELLLSTGQPKSRLH